jgi:hypothetical protein
MRRAARRPRHPAVQRRQRIELALDRPVGADEGRALRRTGAVGCDRDQCGAGAARDAGKRRRCRMLEMHQAYRKGDRKRLAALLPQVRGHPLEPWGAYWELRARLDEASGPQEVQDFPGSAGPAPTRRTGCATTGCSCWASAGTGRHLLRRIPELPHAATTARYAATHLLVAAPLQNPVLNAHQSAEVRRSLATRSARPTMVAPPRPIACWESQKLTPLDAWRKARLAVEANRPKRCACRGAERGRARCPWHRCAELIANPANFLSLARTWRCVQSPQGDGDAGPGASMAANDVDAAIRQPKENKWAIAADG